MLRYCVQSLKSLHHWFRHVALPRLAALRLVLAWSLGVWLTVVAVPYGFLYPEEGLDRPICLLLAGLSPLGVALAALAGEATIVLAAALAGLVPMLVACPALHGPRTSGPVQGLWLALVLIGLVRAVWNQEAAGQKEADLRRLWPYARPTWRVLSRQVPDLLLPLWLLVAWLPPPQAADQAEAARGVRLLGALLCWLAVRLVPLRGELPGLDAAGRMRDRWPLWRGRRASWLALFAGLTWLWRQAP